jgi:hypothetical protein
MEAPSGGSSKPGLPRRSHGEGGSFGSGFFTLMNPGDHRLSAYGNHGTILTFAKDVRLQTMFLGFVVDGISQNVS